MYNGERYLRVAVDSILNQTLRDLELVICDNASTDGTEAICREYAARDPRVRYFRNPSNIGGASNFRRVFELAQARYFKWIAADDYCAPEFLDRCKRVLDDSPDTVVCTTKANMIDQDGQIISRYAERQDLPQLRASDRMIAALAQDSWCIAVYGLMRTEVLRRTAVMGSYSGSDVVLLAEISLYGYFSEVPEYLQFRRYHPGAYSHNVTLDKVREFYAPWKRRSVSFLFRTWRHLFEHVRAIGRAPLPIAERIRLLVYVLRMVWWNRRQLVAELTTALRGMIAS